jgi:ZipA, C-terminal FtsZ-binding domain.
LIVAISFWLAKSQNNNGIRFSKILNKDSDPANLNGSGKKTLNEEVNEIRVPKQAELDLPDENEDNFIILYLQSKIDARPNFDSLKTKIFSNKLTLKNNYFESSTKNKIPNFKILNIKEPHTFHKKKNISLITINLHLKNQKNIPKTFDQMINLRKNLKKSFNIKLLDKNFNKITDQTIRNYKKNTNTIDLKLRSYAN